MNQDLLFPHFGDGNTEDQRGPERVKLLRIWHWVAVGEFKADNLDAKSMLLAYLIIVEKLLFRKLK